MWAWAVAEVPADFNARRALARWYRYTLPTDHDVGRLVRALAVFSGEHDFRNFTRDRTRTVVRIDGATASREADAVVLDFRARSFRWNLVRRLVAAALQVESHAATLDDVRRALDIPVRVDFGLAPPEPLTLMDVLYDHVFLPIADPTTRDRVNRFREERVRSARFMEEVARKLGALPRVAPNV